MKKKTLFEQIVEGVVKKDKDQRMGILKDVMKKQKGKQHSGGKGHYDATKKDISKVKPSWMKENRAKKLIARLGGGFVEE